MACLLTYHSENCMLSSCVGLPDSCCRISRPDTARPVARCETCNPHAAPWRRPAAPARTGAERKAGRYQESRASNGDTASSDAQRALPDRAAQEFVEEHE